MKTVEERFWAKVNKTDTCWLWTGTKKDNGHGHFKVEHKMILAHRYSYELHFGVIPEGFWILRKCNTSLCVNPSHLLLQVAARDKTKEQCFWEKVQKTDGCWLWTGGKDYAGYGSLKIEGAMMGAHRYSYELHVGLIPIGLFVLHHCDNPSCVNPSHLFLGTHKDNMKDMKQKGRGNAMWGEKSGRSKLEETEIKEIFKDSQNGLLQREIADKHGVVQQHISKILNKKIWKRLWSTEKINDNQTLQDN